MIVPNTLILLYANDNVPYMKNKEVEKIQFLRYDVTKWRHNVKIFADLESTHKDLSYDIQHDMVPYGTFDFKIWPWGKHISTRTRPMKVKADRPKKLITLVAAQMLLAHQVWCWSDKSYSKNKGFVDNLL
jgi:hypothetical protein